MCKVAGSESAPPAASGGLSLAMFLPALQRLQAALAFAGSRVCAHVRRLANFLLVFC